MPNIAEYDSWNPVSVIDKGLAASCINNADQKMLLRLLLLPESSAASPSRMNRKALVIDADAPVAIV